MGGYRSGGHNRKKNYVGSSIKIDSYYFSKRLQYMDLAGMDYSKGSMNWGNGNQAEIIVSNEEFTVSYIATQNGNKKSVRDTFIFEYVPNNYGGADRIYFICPYCERRVRFIYLSGIYFKCRTCANLNYRSQQETKGCDVTAVKMKKFIREKFKDSESFAQIDLAYYRPKRPKGMHWETYHRLFEQFCRLQEGYIAQFCIPLMRIVKRFR